MKKINKKATPIITLKGLQSLLSEIGSITNQNSLLVELEDSEAFYFGVKDIDPMSSFFFHITDVEYNKNGEVLFKCVYAPYNDNQVKEVQKELNHTTLIDIYTKWLNRLDTYNSIEISEEDRFKSEYEHEFEEIFEIIDEDAETKPFEIERQIYIYKYLDVVIKKLEFHSGDENREIIEDTKILQENLQNRTKKEVIKSLSRIWAKIRKRGIKLLLDFYDVAKKEALKKLLYGGINEAGTLIDKFF